MVKENYKSCLRYWQKGMTMLEVLVAMLVIGLALVTGISMLQTANRYGDSAEFSAIASQQSQSIIDKIRANSVSASAYLFPESVPTTADYSTLYPQVDTSNIPASIACKTTAPAICATGESVAKQDMQQWEDTLAQQLPNGRGAIRRVGFGTDTYEVIVMWHYNPESEPTGPTPAAHGITVRFTL